MPPRFLACYTTPFLLAFLASANAHAQDQAAQPSSTTTLGAVSVSASALSLGSDEMSTPVTVLEDEELLLRREATLGETLAAQPGIHASHFGAGASRPVIRGMDGPRVKMLSDGAEIQDASTISPDHAVVSEPLLAEKIEVLRGPAALAYGGGAIGGVVNVLDRKIPTSLPDQGLEGSAELRANSGARENAGAFSLTAGTGNLALHAEGVKRHAGDYRVGSGWQDGRRVEGSYNRTETGSLGLSWIGARGYTGVAYTRQRSDYGLPGHSHAYEDCHPHGTQLHYGGHGHSHGHTHQHDEIPFVKLDSERWDVRSEYREPFAGFAKLRVRAGLTDYTHHEMEGEEIATTFTNKAHDGRLELEHHPLAGWRGVWGLQTSQRDFKALGEEAYVDPTVTRKHAAFLVEERELGDWRLEAGLRHEWQTLTVDNAGLPNTRHSGTSLSLGTVWDFMPRHSLSLSVSRVQRLPSAEELYADGIHMATNTYELGNPALGKETAHNIDLSLRKHAGDTTYTLSAFHNRVKNYIYANTLDNHDDFQLIGYTGRDVTFKGIEGEVRHRLNRNLDGTLFGDYVHASLDRPDPIHGSRNLPRLPAGRLGVRLEAAWADWSTMAEWFHVRRQTKVAALEQETPGYSMLNLSAQYNARISKTTYQFYVKANNLTDKLAYSHTSFIKHAAPLMGRNFTVGVRADF